MSRLTGVHCIIRGWVASFANTVIYVVELTQMGIIQRWWVRQLIGEWGELANEPEHIHRMILIDILHFRCQVRICNTRSLLTRDYSISTLVVLVLVFPSDKPLIFIPRLKFNQLCNMLTTAICPFCAARCSAVPPHLSWMLASASMSSSILTMALCPFCAAWCSAVHPHLSWVLASAPLPRSNFPAFWNPK